MEKVLILSVLIGGLFLLIKTVEMKYFDKQAKPLKLIVRDTLIVLGCAFLPLLLFFQFDTKIAELLQMGDGEASSGPSQIFTDEPGF